MNEINFTYSRTNFVNAQSYNERTHATAWAAGIPDFVIDGLELDETGLTISAGTGINNGLPFELGQTGEVQPLELTYNYIYVKTVLDGSSTLTTILETDDVQTDTVSTKYFMIYDRLNDNDLRFSSYIKDLHFESVGTDQFVLVINGTKSPAFDVGEIQSAYSKTESDARFVHLTGAETISGIKTFLSRAIFSSGLRSDENIDVKGGAGAGGTSIGENVISDGLLQVDLNANIGGNANVDGNVNVDGGVNAGGTVKVSNNDTPFNSTSTGTYSTHSNIRSSYPSGAVYGQHLLDNETTPWRSYLTMYSSGGAISNGINMISGLASYDYGKGANFAYSATYMQDIQETNQLLLEVATAVDALEVNEARSSALSDTIKAFVNAKANAIEEQVYNDKHKYLADNIKLLSHEITFLEDDTPIDNDEELTAAKKIEIKAERATMAEKFKETLKTLQEELTALEGSRV